MVQIDWVPMPQPGGDLGLSRKGLGTCFRGAKNAFFLKCSWFKQLDFIRVMMSQCSLGVYSFRCYPWVGQAHILFAIFLKHTFHCRTMSPSPILSNIATKKDTFSWNFCLICQLKQRNH